MGQKLSSIIKKLILYKYPGETNYELIVRFLGQIMVKLGEVMSFTGYRNLIASLKTIILASKTPKISKR